MWLGSAASRPCSTRRMLAEMISKWSLIACRAVSLALFLRGLVEIDLGKPLDLGSESQRLCLRPAQNRTRARARTATRRARTRGSSRTAAWERP